ncbi:dihydrofolate reductase family protein [Streptomyces sp. NPDC001530]|uniref:dihydrofolate reductase family protein n=1 Tax=Streptomyces sp. NPDC001530 TaxID=3364582 RepID=UPI0036A625DC
MPDRPRASPAAGLPVLAEPLEVLYEEPGLPRWQLPHRLAAAYGGDLGLAEPCLYANFVTSLDGVVALGHEYRSSGSAISGREPADRFVMGLLRACADAVLIGAGTLRASPTHHWTPEHVCPAARADFAALRHSLGRAARPELVVVTASGDLPLAHPALSEGALVATTVEGQRLLAGRLPAACTLLAVGQGPRLRMGEVLAAVGARGHALVLTEGGPRLLGHLVGEGLLDELFWTVSPVLAGRNGSRRPGLVDGRELLPGHPVRAETVSIRRRASYLFLRYRLTHNQDPDQQ